MLKAGEKENIFQHRRHKAPMEDELRRSGDSQAT